MLRGSILPANIEAVPCVQYLLHFHVLVPKGVVPRALRNYCEAVRDLFRASNLVNRILDRTAPSIRGSRYSCMGVKQHRSKHDSCSKSCLIMPDMDVLLTQDFTAYALEEQACHSDSFSSIS